MKTSKYLSAVLAGAVLGVIAAATLPATAGTTNMVVYRAGLVVSVGTNIP